MGIPLRVLVLEDSKADYELLLRELRRGGYEPESARVQTAAEFSAALAEPTWDLIVSDFAMPQFDAFEALKIFNHSGLDLPFIILSGTIGEDVAVQALKAGAHDYFMKDKLARLCPAVERELGEAEVRRARKRAEEKLIATEARYRLLADHMTDMVWLMDLNLQTTYNSPSVYRLRGYTLQEIQELPLEKLVAPASLHRALAVFAEEMAKLQADPDYALHVTLELELFCKDGSTLWSESTFSLIRDEHGKPVSLLGEGRDLTERQRAEASLRESERKLKEAQRLGRIGHWSFDLGTGKIEWGEMVFELYERDPKLGLPTAEEEAAYYSPEDARRLRDCARRALETGDTYEVDVRVRLPEERIKDVVVIEVPIKDAHGRVVGLAGTVQDITVRKRTERALADKNRVLTFINNYSNELAFQPPDRINDFMVRRLRDFTGAAAVLITSYDAKSSDLVVQASTLNEESNSLIFRLLGKRIIGFRSHVDPAMYEEITTQVIGIRQSIHEVTFGAVPKPIGAAIQAALGISWFTGAALTKDQQLVGTLMIVGNAETSPLDQEFLSTFSSITGNALERKRGEEALRESEEIFRHFMEHSPIYVFFKDENIRALRLSKNFETMLGKPIEELLGKNMNDLFPSEFAKSMVADDMRILEAGKAITVEEELNGRFYSTTKFPIFIEGKPPCLAGYTIDITERKRAEEALRESEAKYKSLIENFEDIIFTIDLVGKITFAGPAVKEILGYESAETIGMSILDFVPAEDRRRAIETIPKGMSGEKIAHYQTPAITKAGKRVLLELSFSRVYQDGEVVGAQAIAKDITVRRQLEEQLHQAMKMEAIGRLAGGVAHDFNNALTPLLAIGGILLKELNPGHPMYEDIKDMQDSGQRCADLTRQLLAFSRSETRELTVLNLNDVVVNMVKMLSRVIGENIEMVKFIDPKLGNVKADVGQMEQIIANLAINARDAMPGGGKLTLETKNITLDEEYSKNHVNVMPGPHVMLAISDNGSGMDDKTKARLFEPFFTTKEKGKGTGLGLSTVYGIVKQSGGNIWVYTEPGKGATFKIYLPRVDEEAEALGARKRGAAKSSRGSETILLVEDDDNVRKVAKRILEEQGYQVLEAANGEDAIKLSDRYKEKIHLIVTDVVMPGMSGKETADRLLSSRPGVKVLYISGYADNAVVHHGVLDKGTDFFQKPFTVESFAAKVRQVLDPEA